MITKTAIIKDRIFNKDNIARLYNVLNKELENCPIKISQFGTELCSITVVLVCYDGMRYGYSTKNSFEYNDIIDIKRIKSIEMEYIGKTEDYKMIHYINIILEQDNDYNRSCMEIKGEDDVWVEGMFKKIEENVTAAKPQQKWFDSYKWLFFLGGTLVPFCLLYFPFRTLLRSSTSVIAFILISMIIAFWPPIIMSLISWVKKMFPTIEFDFGSEHEKLEKNRRRRLGILLGFLLTSIIMPVILSIIFH